MMSSTPPPPLDPCGPDDVGSFAALDLALRSHPELSREGAAVLNPLALAKVVDGIRTFQDEHLGRVSGTLTKNVLRILIVSYSTRTRDTLFG